VYIRFQPVNGYSAESIGEFYKTMEPVFKIFKMAPDAP